MNFFGLGGFELLLIGAIALFVLGPKRLLEGIREARKVYSDLKRQRDMLQSMITEAIDLEEMKKQIDTETLTKDVKAVTDELTSDVKSATDLSKPSSSVPRKSGPLNRPPIIVDSKVRDAIPDMGLGGTADSTSKAGPDVSGDAGEAVGSGSDDSDAAKSNVDANSDSNETADAVLGSEDDDVGSTEADSVDADEVKS